MEIRIRKVPAAQPELVEIQCHSVTEQVRQIAAFVRASGGRLSGTAEGRQYEIPVSEVFYFEAVDERVFLYTAAKTYEVRQRLYELESDLREKHFLRVSRSVLLNLMQVRSLRPALNGRFLASLANGEEVIISRKYVPELKKTLKGGALK